MKARIDIDMERIEAFCGKYRIVELSLFGSVLRDDFGADSDVDVLATFAGDARMSLFDLMHAEDELGGILGRKADLVLEDGLVNPFRRKHILANREQIYAA